MKNDSVMDRLAAAAPTAGEPADHSAVFAQIVADPGDSRLTGAPVSHAPRLLGWRRPRVLAGGSLGLAAIAAAPIVALGGGAAAAPAFAVTREANGTVLVSVNTRQGVIPADGKLLSMGIKEQVNYETAPGPATSSAPVACQSVAGPDIGYHTVSGYEAASPSGPPVSMRLGSDNTQVIAAPNTGAGTVHLSSCVYYPYGPGTQVGNSGQAFLKANGLG